MHFKETNDPSVLPWARAEQFLLQLLELLDLNRSLKPFEQLCEGLQGVSNA